jgi:hypothetical protein
LAEGISDFMSAIGSIRQLQDEELRGILARRNQWSIASDPVSVLSKRRVSEP